MLIVGIIVCIQINYYRVLNQPNANDSLHQMAQNMQFNLRSFEQHFRVSTLYKQSRIL